MLYKSKYNCIFVELYSTRYIYANTEVRCKPFFGGAQTAHQACEVWGKVCQDNIARQHSSCRGQEWEEAHDSHGSSRSLQHFAHYSTECSGQIRDRGTQAHHYTEETRNATSPSQVHGRRGSKDNSDSMQCTARRSGQMDTSAIVRASCGTGNSSFHIAYARRPHSKKNGYKPHLRKMWCIPPHQNAAFVAQMEDVLEVYSRPRDPKRPLVCMDEQPIELHHDSRQTIHLSEDNHTERVDHEYVRNGTCCGFMFTAPHECWRRVTIRTQRCKTDWAQEIKQLVDEDYPYTEKIVLVCDNLNTHNISSLYEAFEPAEARRIWERLELHHTPKHGSWLDMAEIELSAFTKECLGRRIGDIDVLKTEATAWYRDRNQRQKGIDWQFSIGDARLKLKHLYPVINIKN